MVYDWYKKVVEKPIYWNVWYTRWYMQNLVYVNYIKLYRDLFLLYPSLINLETLKELWLQQEVKDTHNNKLAYNNQPNRDSRSCTACTDLIEQHFCQIQGINGAPCTYLMFENSLAPTLPALADDGPSCLATRWSSITQSSRHQSS